MIREWQTGSGRQETKPTQKQTWKNNQTTDTAATDEHISTKELRSQYHRNTYSINKQGPWHRGQCCAVTLQLKSRQVSIHVDAVINHECRLAAEGEHSLHVAAGSAQRTVSSIHSGISATTNGRVAILTTGDPNQVMNATDHEGELY